MLTIVTCLTTWLWGLTRFLLRPPSRHCSLMTWMTWMTQVEQLQPPTLALNLICHIQMTIGIHMTNDQPRRLRLWGLTSLCLSMLIACIGGWRDFWNRKEATFFAPRVSFLSPEKALNSFSKGYIIC
eukprot:Rmarinus@m.8885